MNSNRALGRSENLGGQFRNPRSFEEEGFDISYCQRDMTYRSVRDVLFT